MRTQQMVQRDIVRTWRPTPQQKGPGHRAAMVLEPGRWAEFDPFLMMAEDWFQTGTFALHPHRGIETVTYVIDGTLNHYDNKAGAGQLLPGDVQWMTAGRGVIHSEDPEEGSTVHSLQLWVNLPRAAKMADPRYQNLRRADMPVRHEAGAEVVVFSGSSGDVASPTRNHVPVTYVELVLEPGAMLAQDLPASYNGFVYVLDGLGRFGANEQAGAQGDVLWLGKAGHTAAGGDGTEVGAAVGSPDAEGPASMSGADAEGPAAHEGMAAQAGSEVTVRADTKLRALLIAGEPLHEPVVAHGPFVMNTKAEILQAFTDYQAGKFA